MIGRAIRGRPWIFREINHYLKTDEILPVPDVEEIQQLVHQHLLDHYEFYGEAVGVMSARKHIGWYITDLPDSEVFRKHINAISCSSEQLGRVDDFFKSQLKYGKKLQYAKKTGHC
jgi:tRNA-dihydrouridine synthase B